MHIIKCVAKTLELEIRDLIDNCHLDTEGSINIIFSSNSTSLLGTASYPCEITVQS